MTVVVQDPEEPCGDDGTIVVVDDDVVVIPNAGGTDDLGDLRSRAHIAHKLVNHVIQRPGREVDRPRKVGLLVLVRATHVHYPQVVVIQAVGEPVGFDEQVKIFVDFIDPGLPDRLGPDTMGKITRIYADSFLEYPPPAHVDALPALQGIKEMGLRIGLISNTGMTPGATFRTYLENQGMLGYFDVLTFSDEVKLSKPGNEIFMMTLRSLGAAPAETVHVGDHIQNDVLGAKRCGLKTVWITGFSEREDPDDPETEPDVTVDGLGAVAPAIAKLAGRS